MVMLIKMVMLINDINLIIYNTFHVGKIHRI